MKRQVMNIARAAMIAILLAGAAGMVTGCHNPFQHFYFNPFRE